MTIPSNNIKLLLILQRLTFAYSLLLAPLSIADSVVAVINDEVITLDSMTQQMKSGSSKAEKMALLNHKIDLELQLKKAKELGIQPKTAAINIMIGRIASSNNLTLAQLQSSPEFDTVVTGITKELTLRGLKQFVLEGVEINLTTAEIDQAVAKNPSEVGSFGKQIKIAQILISSLDKTNALQSQDESSKQFLMQLSDKINHGASFSSLAKLHSQHPSYKNGGESRWLNPKKLPAIFKQQLSNLKLAQLSKPFRNKQGWWIIKISKERNAKDARLASIKSQLMQAKENIYFKDWVKKLRKNTYIEIFEHKL